jgi:hypothetical protein
MLILEGLNATAQALSPHGSANAARPLAEAILSIAVPRSRVLAHDPR